MEDKTVEEKIDKLKRLFANNKIGITKLDNNLLPSYTIEKHKKDKNKSRKKNKQQKQSRKNNR